MSVYMRRGRVILAWLYFGTLTVSGAISLFNWSNLGQPLHPAMIVFFGTLFAPLVLAGALLLLGSVFEFIEWSVQQWN